MARINPEATTGCDDLPAPGAIMRNREFAHLPSGVILLGVL
jgi:hypothetical protein